MSSKGATHPYIRFAVDSMEQIGFLMRTGQEGMGLDFMDDVLHSVDPKARFKQEWKDLNKDMQKTMIARAKVTDADPVVLETRLRGFDYYNKNGYKDLKSRLWLILWKNGYMYANTFQGIDLSLFNLDEQEGVEIY